MNLEKLTDQELLTATKNLVAKERALTHLVLKHLAEVEIRKLYADLKYSSLFEYCMQELNYSEDESYRRISAMRFLNKNPEIKEHVEKGEIALSSLNLLDQFQKRSDVKVDINDLLGKSKREVQAILNEKLPTQKKYSVKLNLTKDSYEKLMSLKEAEGVSLEELIDKLCDQKIKEKAKNHTVKRASSLKKINSRYIPIAVRAHARQVSGNRCQNCGGTTRLEYNHIIPYAKGGEATPSNINLICKSCNQRQMVRDFGDRIRRKILEASTNFKNS